MADGEPPLPPFTQPPSVADSWPPGSSLSISRNSSGRVISELQSQLSEVRREADALRAELKVVQKRNTVLVTERDEAVSRSAFLGFLDSGQMSGSKLTLRSGDPLFCRSRENEGSWRTKGSLERSNEGKDY
jgi:hypothetical protein